MRILVTGATGFIGSAVAAELQQRGHEVMGLARSERSGEVLRNAGFGVRRGDIADPESVASGLDQIDAVVHTAFNHDFSRYVDNCKVDGRLLDALASELEGTEKALIAASATTVASPAGEFVTEKEGALEEIPRSASEAFLGYSERGVRTGVVRLPPSVHGVGDTAFVPMLISLARQQGASAHVGGGENRWPAVHRNDAARLFCDAVERPRPGARYHAVAESDIPYRAIANAIGDGLGLATQGVPSHRAEAYFGWLAAFAAIDNPTSSQWTRETIGWEPREIGLISDMHEAGYFDSPSRDRPVATPVD